MINPNWLNTFCTLVEQQHFTVTANKLFMTQSGVSQQIKKLEQQLDTQLLVREGKSFSLTEAGSKLYQQGRELLHQFAELENQLQRDHPHQGEVKICSPGSVGLRLYPYLLSLQAKYPKLLVNYKFAPNKGVVTSLLDRTADLGISTEAYESHKLMSTAIAQEELMLVTSADISNISWSKLLQLGVVAHPDSAHHCSLLLSKNFEQFEHVEQFEQKGFSNQIGLILTPVSLGLGFTVLPMHAVKAFHNQAGIRTHTLPETVKETLYLCRDKRAVLPARIEYMASEITSYLAQLS